MPLPRCPVVSQDSSYRPCIGLDGAGRYSWHIRENAAEACGTPEGHGEGSRGMSQFGSLSGDTVRYGSNGCGWDDMLFVLILAVAVMLWAAVEAWWKRRRSA